MQYRQLGRGGPRVSAIGLGCLGLTFAAGTPERARTLATLDRALELGIDFFDTADNYGNGASEECLAEAFAQRRDKVFIATKFGQMKAGDRRVDGRPEHVARACDASLARLSTDAIDLYYLHRVDPLVPIEETIGAMKRLVEQGKVRWIGLSEASPSTIARAHAVHPVTALQNEYSLWAREPEDAVLDVCRDLGIALVSYSPLGRGFLSGAIRDEQALAPDDWRRKNPRFSAENIGRNLQPLAMLERIAARLDATPAQVALAWVLAQGDDIVPIPGSTHIRHLESNVAAVQLTLSADDMSELANAFPRGMAAGPRHNEDALQMMNR